VLGSVEEYYQPFIFMKLYKPPNMPKTPKFDDARVNEAYEAACLQKKPNIAKIAREFGVPYRTLHGRVHGQRKPRTARIPANRALNQYQEAALVS
jgi:hypothetical protein